MIIKSLKLKNYRNYSDLDIAFDQKTNILYGDNAQGKTNIIESLYVCGTSKSHKGSKDKELIRFGQDESHIRTIVEKKGIEHQIDIHLKKSSSKGIAIDKIAIKKASELFGILNLIIFSPEDLNIIKEGPSERRRFIDMELSQLDKIYLYDLTNYNKVLQQRNKLLKDMYYNNSLKATLPVWDQQLCTYGKRIIESRVRFIEKINGIIHDIHKNISGDREDIVISYEPSVSADEFEKELELSIDKDLRYGTTSVGPHRDDMSFIVNGVDIRKYGSQGQQRTAALSLKLAEIELVREQIKDSPVLLLDDVLSELDSNRQQFLLQSIDGIQTIITCTGLDEFVKNRFEINKVFYVKEGTVT